jgi:dolichol-phosphate hexosyltransferase
VLGGPTPARSSASASGSASDLRDDTVVLVPAYREASGIGLVIEELRRAIDPLILVINRPDGDGTEAAARRRGAVVVNQPGKGKGDAVRLGLEYVHEHFEDARYIGLIDADCTYPSAAIPPMRAILDSDPSIGMVVARRQNLANDGVPSRAFAFGNRMLAQVHRLVNQVPMQDPLSGLRLFKAEIVQDWSPKSRGFDIECELNYYVHNVKGFGITEVPVPYRTRVGEKKLKFQDGLRILARMFRLRLEHARAPVPVTAGAAPEKFRPGPTSFH